MALVQAVAVVVITLAKRNPTVVPYVPQAFSGTHSEKLPGTAKFAGCLGISGSEGAGALMDELDVVAADEAGAGCCAREEQARRQG